MPRKKTVDIEAELLKIHKTYGSVSPANILQVAKRKRHPLHRFFSWDDTEAAKKWRVHQANMLIASAKVIIEPHEKRTVSAFVSVKSDDSRKFVHIAEAMSNDALALQIFNQLEARIDTLQDQLQSLDLLKGTSKTALVKAKAPITKRREQLEKRVARAAKKKKAA